MMENVKKFFEELERNDKALELLKAASVDGKEPGSAALADIARQTGYDVTDEEMRACCEEERKRRAADSDAVAEKLGELNPEDMEAAAGGKDPSCRDTYNEGEWCWFADSCSASIRVYTTKRRVCSKNDYDWCIAAD